MGTTTSILYNYVFTTADTFYIRVRFCDDDNQWGAYYTFTIEIVDCKRYYYVKDHLGNIRQTVDENGVIISAQDYSPYGEIIRSYNNADVNDKYKFTEKERDKETNLDYFGARYYDASIGRWLAVDPLASNYPGWSGYNYVFNNPLLLIDPKGLDSTIYIRSLTNKASRNDMISISKQAQKILDDNGVPMTVKVIAQGGFVNLEMTDILVDIGDDNNPLIKSEKSKNKDAEGCSPIGQQQGVITIDMMNRKGVDLNGIATSSIHEGLHGMGLTHQTHGAKGTIIYENGGSVTINQLNNTNQVINQNQLNAVNLFLSKEIFSKMSVHKFIPY